MITLIIVIFGTSFAVFRITLKQEDENELTSACLKLEYTDENPISIKNAIPIVDEEGKKLVPYQFTLRNMCKTNVTYQVNLEVLDTTTFEDLSYIKLELNDKEPILLTENELVEKTIDNAKVSYSLKRGYLEQDESKTYTLRLWMDSNTPTSEKYMEKSLKSKVTITGESYPKEIDKTPPIASFTTTETEEGILVDASNSTDNDSGIMTYYYSKDNKTWYKSEDARFLLRNGDEVTYGLGVDVVEQLANLRVNDVYVKVEDKFENMSEVVGKSIRLGGIIYDKTTDNNIRYIGANPNNYVTFNNELWRIIGSFNNIVDGEGNSATRLKIIRNQSIGNLQWNNNSSTNWAASSLKTHLNQTYYNSLTEESKKMISNCLWKIGATSNFKQIPIGLYNNERGTTTYNGNPATWVGNIALIYPSDYGLATNGTGSLGGRNNCMNRVMYDWSNNWGNCPNGSWLNINKSLFLTPHSTSWILLNDGYIRIIEPTISFPVKPTLYLNENIKITSGTGTSTDPFILGL